MRKKIKIECPKEHLQCAIKYVVLRASMQKKKKTPKTPNVLILLNLLAAAERNFKMIKLAFEFRCWPKINLKKYIR